MWQHEGPPGEGSGLNQGQYGWIKYIFKAHGPLGNIRPTTARERVWEWTGHCDAYLAVIATCRIELASARHIGDINVEHSSSGGRHSNIRGGAAIASTAAERSNNVNGGQPGGGGKHDGGQPGGGGKHDGGKPDDGDKTAAAMAQMEPRKQGEPRHS